jgi:hypothetical protein
MKHFLLLTICAILNCQEVWIGITVNEIGENGKIVSNYVAGTSSQAALDKVQEGLNPESFLRLDNVLYIDSADGTYEMNGDSHESREESNTVFFKIKTIHSITLLRVDPRTVYRKSNESDKSKNDPFSLP